jgi:hypothetical protein
MGGKTSMLSTSWKRIESRDGLRERLKNTEES